MSETPPRLNGNPMIKPMTSPMLRSIRPTGPKLVALEPQRENRCGSMTSATGGACGRSLAWSPVTVVGSSGGTDAKHWPHQVTP
ncbi:MAG: hypothetical protein QOI81_520 [Actinomycetota bacterium]|nr:hypothetical protein [Actinomycetota bacterium]